MSCTWILILRTQSTVLCAFLCQKSYFLDQKNIDFHFSSTLLSKLPPGFQRETLAWNLSLHWSTLVSRPAALSPRLSPRDLCTTALHSFDKTGGVFSSHSVCSVVFYFMLITADLFLNNCTKKWNWLAITHKFMYNIHAYVLL